MDPRLTLAFEHHRAGRLGEAEPLYQSILQDQPDDAAALHGWGLLAAQRDQMEVALERVSRATELAPAEASFWKTLGRLHARQADFPAAVSAYRRAVQFDPTDGHTWDRLTVASRQSGFAEEAVTAGERAARLLPNNAEVHNHLGNALCDAGRDTEAVESFETALRLRPDLAEACTNLGSTLTRLGRWDEAIERCDQAVALAPELPEAHNNRGVTLASVGRLEEAITAYRRAVVLRPDYAAAHSNWGVALCDQGADADAALAECRHAVALQPDEAVLHTNLAMILLTLGRYSQGWAEHPWRLRANPRISPRTFSEPHWQGEPLPTGTLVIHAEQGFGDTIQFARFIPLAARLVRNVIVEVQPELTDLLRAAWPDVQILSRGAPLPPFDVHCPLMSLPLPLGVNDPSLIPGRPYLQVPAPVARHSWKPGRHIGIVWAGRPTHSNDRNRSAPLASLAPLAGVPGVTFHSLQQGPPAREALTPPPGLHLEIHDDNLHDFAHTAALIASLDGVIAVDTAVAHLAGAMGKPVWLLLPRVADWRWMRGRTDSPWYPTARLFRQSTWGDWTGAAERLATDLCAPNGGP